MDKPDVVIMGLGYIGLPTAALIASRKIKILGVDTNPSVVDTINNGKIHIVEPDLEGLVKDVVSKGFLRAGNKPKEADAYIIAVPTPFKEDKNPDLTYVYSAIDMIIPHLKAENLVILESTSPIGTTEDLMQRIYNKRPELSGKLYISYCPERVLPGQIIHELQQNDRVIGGIDENSANKALEFYLQFVKGELHRTNSRTAEMCKLVENAYRDINIAFANELSMISDKAEINVYELIELANKHPRVNILKPGPGVGGHCIAVDPWFIISQFKDDSRIIHNAREINISKTEWVLNKIRSKMEKFNKEKVIIACMGLAYKADVDDLRESPALYITKTLIEEGYKILPVEPNLKEHKDFDICNYNEAAKKADVLIFLVPHRHFKNIKLEAEKVILDFCGSVKFYTEWN